MGCLARIREFYSTFTTAEKKIADYVLAHPSRTLELNAVELASESEVSPATAVRFARSAGFNGFSEMKIDLARDVEAVGQSELDIIMHLDDSYGEIARKLAANVSRTLAGTLDLLKTKDFEQAIQWLQEAEIIYLFGIGASGLVAEDLQKKLVRINKRCVYFPDANLGVATSIHITSKDAALAFSYSGQTKEVNIATRTAKQNGAKCISVTKCGKSALASIADICLYVTNMEPEIRLGAMQSRYAHLFMVDLIYMSLAKNQFDVIEDYLERSRSLIRQLKEG